MFTLEKQVKKDLYLNEKKINKNVRKVQNKQCFGKRLHVLLEGFGVVKQIECFPEKF